MHLAGLIAATESTGASSSSLQVVGIVITAVMGTITALGMGLFGYWTIKQQEQTKRDQQRIDEKLKQGAAALCEGNDKLDHIKTTAEAIDKTADVIHVLTNSRLTMLMRAMIVLKRKLGEPLTEEELALEQGDADPLAKNVSKEAADKKVG